MQISLRVWIDRKSSKFHELQPWCGLTNTAWYENLSIFSDTCTWQTFVFLPSPQNRAVILLQAHLKLLLTLKPHGCVRHPAPTQPCVDPTGNVTNWDWVQRQTTSVIVLLDGLENIVSKVCCGASTRKLSVIQSAWSDSYNYMFCDTASQYWMYFLTESRLLNYEDHETYEIDGGSVLVTSGISIIPPFEALGGPLTQAHVNIIMFLIIMTSHLWFSQ